jgi:hypothetical protein
MKTTSPVFASLLVTAMLSGCALSGAGAGIFGAPTQTAGQTPAGSTASDKDKKPSEPANKANAGKPVDKVTTSANDLVILVKKTQKAQATVTYLDGSKDGDVQWVSK